MQLPPLRFNVKGMMVAVAVFALGLAIAPTRAAYLSLLMPMTVALVRLAPRAQFNLALSVLALLAGAEIVLGEPVHLSLYLPVAIALSGPIWTCYRWWERPQATRLARPRLRLDRRPLPHHVDEP